MRKEKLYWLEKLITQGINNVLAELEQDDSQLEKQNFSDLENQLKKRKENSSSHKKVEELRRIIQNK